MLLPTNQHLLAGTPAWRRRYSKMVGLSGFCCRPCVAAVLPCRSELSPPKWPVLTACISRNRVPCCCNDCPSTEGMGLMPPSPVPYTIFISGGAPESMLYSTLPSYGSPWLSAR